MKIIKPALFIFIALFLGACTEDQKETQSGSISVVSTPSGAAVSIDGKSFGMSPVTAEGLSIGTHLVTMNKPGYRDVRKSINLLEGQSAPLEVILEKSYGLLLVHSEPQGADISIGGKFRGQTPLLITDLELGRHTVAFNLPGYQPRETEIDVSDRYPHKTAMNLVTDSGQIALVSTPPGAVVVVGGQEAGRTPFTLDRLAAGTHNVEFQLSGYKTITRSVVINPGDMLDLNVALIAIPGSLQLISIPSEGRVYIDNQYRGNTPMEIPDLNPGSYRIRVDVEGYTSVARDVAVTRNGHTIEEFRLERNAGYFELVTEPAGVAVYIDGKHLGESKAGLSDVISNPMRIYTLEPGPHTLHLTRKGYSYQPKQFLVTRETPVTLHEKLKRLYIPDTRVRLKEAPTIPVDGVLLAKEANGDIEIMVSESAIRKIKAEAILAIEPLRVDPTQ